MEVLIILPFGTRACCHHRNIFPEFRRTKYLKATICAKFYSDNFIDVCIILYCNQMEFKSLLYGKQAYWSSDFASDFQSV